jgi:hypothetical protein
MLKRGASMLCGVRMRCIVVFRKTYPQDGLGRAPAPSLDLKEAKALLDILVGEVEKRSS